MRYPRESGPPARTVLALRIQQRRWTYEEFVAYADKFARAHGEAGTISARRGAPRNTTRAKLPERAVTSGGTKSGNGMAPGGRGRSVRSLGRCLGGTTRSRMMPVEESSCSSAD